MCTQRTNVLAGLYDTLELPHFPKWIIKNVFSSIHKESPTFSFESIKNQYLAKTKIKRFSIVIMLLGIILLWIILNISDDCWLKAQSVKSTTHGLLALFALVWLKYLFPHCPRLWSLERFQKNAEMADPTQAFHKEWQSLGCLFKCVDEEGTIC